MAPAVPPGLVDIVAGLVPGARLLSVEPLAPDTGAGATGKAAGYGEPLRVRLRDAGGEERQLVFRTAGCNEFGHDRRADRWEETLLAFDTFGTIPGHVRALDVGAVLPGGRLVSLREAGEAWLLTTWAEGTLYADDLRRVAASGEAAPLDRERCRALAVWAARLHREKLQDPVAWRRALRDLCGHGEGIAGVADAYPDGVPGAPRARVERLERACQEWRFRLRPREERLSRTHGDFHPFNVVFGEGTGFALLDASRGGRGDPADDVAAMAVNYLFFAAGRPEAWPRGLGPLWDEFFAAYLGGGGDPGALDALAPFLAWRALVVCCPRFYPRLGAPERDRILGIAERALAAPRFDPAWAGEAFR